MITLVFFLVCVLVALGVGLLAALSDIRGLQIPNIYSAIIAAGFPVCYALMWLFGNTDMFMPLWSHITSALIVLAVSAILFFRGVMGAADSKLASAFSLWLGLSALPVFLFVMSLFGALLGVAALYIKKKKPFKAPAKGSWAEQLQAGKNKVPYGVAIVAGAIYAFYHVGYLQFEELALAFGI